MKSKKNGRKRAAEAKDDANMQAAKQKKRTILPDLTTLEKPTPVSKTYVGPWKDYKEFEIVYGYLYLPCSIERPHAKALCMLDIWINRRSTVCPAGVLATHVLLEALEKNKCERYEQKDLQSFFASAIIRFFNFMSSTVQEHNMRSMYDTAKKLGLNSSIVDVRHLCSHGQLLPDFETLVGNVEYAMEWLQGHYWHPLLDKMKAVMPVDITSPILKELKNKVSILFKIYDSAFMCFVHGASDKYSAHEFLKGTRYDELLSYAQRFKVFKLRDILHSVVGNLAKLFCNALALVPDAASSIDYIYIDGLLELQHFYKYPCSKNNESAAKVFDAAQCLFRMLSVYGLLKDYFTALMHSCEKPDLFGNVRVKGAAFWAKKLVQGFSIYILWRTQFKEEVSKILNFSN